MSQSASYSPVVSKIFRSRAIILDQLSEKRDLILPITKISV